MKLHLAILEILARRAPELVREIPLRNAIEIELGKPVSLADLKAKLRDLESAGDVASIANEDSGTKWTLTDRGSARLARALE